MVGNFAVKNLSNALDQEYDILYDVNLRVSGVMIPCHKLALALSSPVFAKLLFSGKDLAEPSLKYDGDVVTMKYVDPEVIRMIVKFCYNKRLELSSRSLIFLVELYITAASLEIPDLQEVILKQKVMFKVVTDDDEDLVPEEDAWDIIDLALRHKDHPKLVDSLFTKASDILKRNYIDRSDELLPRLKKKLQDKIIIQLLLQKLGLDDMCGNCKQYSCLDRKDVTERNFVPGARVRVKNPRSSKSNPALVTLGQLDTSTRMFTGLTISGVPVPASRFLRNAYIFDCSQHFD